MILLNEIDFDECLKDSPAYRYVSFSISTAIVHSLSLRYQLRQATYNIDMLEDRLEQVAFPFASSRASSPPSLDVQIV